MNTNSKHYEELKVQPWEIMEKNFTTEEFVAYLKGNIIKYTLRDKGQALTDAQKIKHYAEKLIEVLQDEQKKTLKPNKWYDAEDYTVEELKELLPVGTKVIVIEDFTTNNNDNNVVELGKETWLNTTVQNIDKTASTERTRVGITGDIFFRRYFRIVEEN